MNFLLFFFILQGELYVLSLDTGCRLQLGCSSVEKSFCRIIRLFDPHHIARELASHIFSLPHFQINQLETYKIEGQKVDIINPLSLHSELLRN